MKFTLRTACLHMVALSGLQCSRFESWLAGSGNEAGDALGGGDASREDADANRGGRGEGAKNMATLRFREAIPPYRVVVGGEAERPTPSARKGPPRRHRV